jgi:orotidine-5'-phosphate decarboxylase
MIPDDCFSKGKADLEGIALGFEKFAFRLMDVLAPHVAAIKPQIAFYEAYGLPGMQAYVNILKRAKELDLISIADIKRGDIGSTAEAYAQAHLGGPQSGPFEADAVTINPWLGGDSLEPFFKRCQEREKGVYLLLHTSNPGSKDLQECQLQSGPQLYQHLATLIDQWQAKWTPEGDYSSIGVVVGATYPEQLVELKAQLPRAPFLVPGYGSQGGKGKDVATLYGDDWTPHLINASRSLTFAYLEKGTTLEEGALQAAEAMKQDILNSTRLTF